MKDIEQQEKFIELRATGKSFRAISSELGVSKTTLIDWSKDLAEDISNQREVELDYLREEYKIGKQYRMKLYSNQLEALNKELEKRDFSDVPTPKLIELQLKISNTLLSEEHQPSFSKSSSAYAFEDLSKSTDSWSA
jgi:hypothetical protein